MKTLVMEGRRRWMIGGEIGLSRSFTFIGGEIVAVSDEDAAILLDPGKTGDHVFVATDTDEAAAVLAEAESRAALGAWKSPGKCCDDPAAEVDVVAVVEDDAVTVVETAGAGEATSAVTDEDAAAWGGVRVRIPPRNRPGGPAGRR